MNGTGCWARGSGRPTGASAVSIQAMIRWVLSESRAPAGSAVRGLLLFKAFAQHAPLQTPSPDGQRSRNGSFQEP